MHGQDEKAEKDDMDRQDEKAEKHGMDGKDEMDEMDEMLDDDVWALHADLPGMGAMGAMGADKARDDDVELALAFLSVLKQVLDMRVHA